MQGYFDAASLGQEGLEGATTPGGVKKRGRPPAAVWNNFTGVGEVKSTTKRRPACCNFCKHVIIDSRVEALLKHIVRDCTKTTPEVRQQADADLQARAVAAQVAAVANVPDTKPTKSGEKKPRLAKGLELALSAGQGAGNGRVEALELRFFLLHDLPLAVADSPALLELVKALRPKHSLADAARLRSAVVNAEYAKMLAETTTRVAAATSATLAASNTVMVGHQHVLGCSVLLPDRSCTLVHALEAPSDVFVPTELFAVLKDTIERLGPDRVAAVVTDGSLNLRSATQQLVMTDQYTHMLVLRCHAHLFGELLASCLSHSWAQNLILDAHNLVLHINNSAELVSVMLQAVGANAEATTMLLPITESFSSLYPSLSALLQLESAIRLLLQHHQVALANPETKALLLNFSSANLGVLMELLEQFHRAMDAMENRKASLADLTRYWIYIARTLDALKSRCPGGFVEHCELAYQRSASQLDVDTCRLALFLDPRFKQAADTGRSFPKLLQNVCPP